MDLQFCVFLSFMFLDMRPKDLKCQFDWKQAVFVESELQISLVVKSIISFEYKHMLTN
jgi:hypothetical protein